MKVWVGVDVSKATLDVYWIENERPIYFKIPNSCTGFESLLSSLPPCPHLVMEATGTYYLQLANFLFKHNVPLSVVNPISIKRYAQMKLVKTKTDKFDSAVIAGFGESQKPEEWTLPEAKVFEMQQLCTLEAQLVVQKGMMTNEQEAFSQNPFASKTASKAILKLVQCIDSQLKIIAKKLEEITDENYSREMEILCSIPGIGAKTAQSLLVVTRGFKTTKNGRELCSFIGIAPRTFQSGTSVRGRGRISKMGNNGLRKKLYMCTLKAITCNPACMAFYARLKANGKPSKVALIAVGAKLLRQAVAMIKSDKVFDEKLAMGA
jgi:transposase